MKAKLKLKQVEAAAMPSLADRIEALHKEIEALVAEHVDKIALGCPGVPKGVLEQTVFNRARGCRCEEHKMLLKATQ